MKWIEIEGMLFKPERINHLIELAAASSLELTIKVTDFHVVNGDLIINGMSPEQWVEELLTSEAQNVVNETPVIRDPQNENTWIQGSGYIWTRNCGCYLDEGELHYVDPENKCWTLAAYRLMYAERD